MIINRRELLAGLLALGACSRGDGSGGDVFAAGQPAAILLLALAPERLIGWPRRPPPPALAMLPGADLQQTGALTGGGAPASMEAVAALGPRMILDYGDVDPRFRDIAARAEERLGVPYHLIDGALARIPEAFAEGGRLLDRAERGAQLAARAGATLDQWRQGQGERPSFYYARGGDGLETGFAGSLAVEVLEGAGWRNVAVGGSGIGRVSREQVAAWDAEVVVTLDQSFADAATNDTFWRERRGGGRRRLLLVPDLPFGWMDRPPSVNRLLGCAWLGGGPQAAAELATLMWNVPAGPLSGIAPRWIA